VRNLLPVRSGHRSIRRKRLVWSLFNRLLRIRFCGRISCIRSIETPAYHLQDLPAKLVGHFERPESSHRVGRIEVP